MANSKFKIEFVVKLTILLCGLIFFSCIYSSGQQYQVSGQIQITHYNPDGSKSGGEMHHFHVQVAGCTWQITMQPSDSKSKDINSMSFDGTNMYSFQDAETEYLHASPPPKAKNRALGKVADSIAVPHEMGSDGVGELWVAYASSCYFGTHKDSGFVGIPYWQTTPFALFQEQRLQPATWELNIAKPCLPKNVSYFSSDRTNDEAEYRVFDYTNYEGLVLPQRSVFTIDRPPRWRRASTNGVVAIRYDITSDEIDQLTRPVQFPPALPVMTAILDYRFLAATDNLPVILYMTGERFLTMGEVRLSPAYSEVKSGHYLPVDPATGYMQSRSSGDKTRPGLKKWALVIFVLLNAMFVVHLLKNKLKQNRKEREKL